LRSYYNKRKEKYFALEKDIKAARLPITPYYIIGVGSLYGFILALGLSIFLYLVLPSYVIDLNRYHLPIEVSFPIDFKRPVFSLKVIAVPIFFIFWFLFYYIVLAYPSFKAKVRAGNIDLTLPHAVNMLLAASKGGVPLLQMFKIVAEERNLTQEIGKEFSEVIKRITYFNEDITSAMRYVSSTTPSSRFSNFIEDFIAVIESGGKIDDFLKMRSNYLMEEKERYERAFLDTLEAFAEVYLALFVVGPLFLMITLVVMGIVGQEVESLLKIVVYLFIPLGSLGFVYIIRTIVKPGTGKWISKRITGLSFFSANVDPDKPSEVERPSIFKRMTSRVKSRLRILFSDVGIYTVRPENILYITIPVTLIILFTMKERIVFESQVIFLAAGNILPYTVFYEIRKQKMAKIEELIPDFLRQMASLNEAGMNAVEAIRILSTANLGVLTKEIIKIKREVEWGKLLTEAFQKFEQRVGSILISKVVSMLVKAIESSYRIRDALSAAASSAYMEVESARRIKREMVIYVMLIYISYGVFLFTVVVILKNFISVFAGIEVPEVAGTSFNVPDLPMLTRLFYHTSLLGGFFSGLAAGIMGEGDVRSGLKHSMIIVLMTFFVFKLFVGG
jgi:flagellar protein FlaJ